MRKRIISLVLVVSIFVSCFVVPVNANPALPGVVTSVSGLITSAGLGATISNMLHDIASSLKVTETTVSNVMDILVSFVGYGRMPQWKLQNRCDFLNALTLNPIAYSKLVHDEGVKRGYWLADDTNIEVVDILNYICSYEADIIDWHITSHPEYGFVIANASEKIIFADSLGRFPYADQMEDFWLREESALSSNAVVPVGERGLETRLNSLRDYYPGLNVYIGTAIFNNGLKYKVIYQNADELYIWSDYEGRPYVVPLDPDEWASSGSNDFYPEDEDGDGKYDDGEPESSQIVDVNAGIIVLPDGSLTFVDDIYYDHSTKTYVTNTSTTYNNTTNTFVTYNYHIEYHINYTSVTYIGATDEYTETYDYYYQLPDGRSSADLTAEELQVLNTQIDVLPYNRSADDTSIRALYHFDGDCLDSSYWSHLGSLSWTTGASITYMDANKFNGALYLDENAHDFTITLPSTLGVKDWTIQWRYYQSHTLTPVRDSYFAIGGLPIMRFDGASIYTPVKLTSILGETISFEAVAPVSVGSWQEIAVVRKDGAITYFLNGVPIGSAFDAGAMAKTLHFVFGADQQTFKYFDELRVVSAALYDAEKGYVPSSVPHDTNLALVLPDEDLPVADEYWSITSSGENLLSEYGMDWMTELVTSGNPYISSSTSTTSSREYPAWCYNAKYTDFVVDGGLSLTSITSTYDLFYESTTTGVPYYGFYTLLYKRTGNSSNELTTEVCLPVGDYVFSVVTEDGTITSLPFTRKNATATDYVVEGGGYRLAMLGDKYTDSYDNVEYHQYLAIQPLQYDVPAPRIVYMELIKGTETDLSAEFISSIVVMKKEDLNTPSLAVRTDTTITGYQIGGVRPSLPSKGLVWALVESGRITSLQIYNGQAWVAVDGRIWTGSRWVPYYAYDVLLLKDLWDIVESDPTIDPIYTEEGFWSWFQNAWSGLISRLDSILAAVRGLSGTPVDPENPSGSNEPSGLPGVSCTHAYVLDSEVPASCAAPGQRNFECPVCGAQYIEVVSAFGHDWVAEETKPDTYSLPEDTACPDCASTEFAAVLDEADAQYSCTCNSCSKEWVQNALLVKGETTYKCTICELTYVGTEHPDSVEAEESWTLIDIVGIVKDGVWTIITGVVRVGVGGLSGLVSGISGLGGFFDAYDTDTPGGVFDIMNVGSEEFWS